MLELGLTNRLFDYNEDIKYFYQTKDYAFTPFNMAQYIMRAEGPIPKDPNYMKWIHESAQKYLDYKLTDQQAFAVKALGDLNDSIINKEEDLYQLILKDTEVCEYLPYGMNADDLGKHSLIKSHAQNYKKTVFLASHAFLTIDDPNTDDKKRFAVDIYQAECTLRKDALGIDRSLWRKVMRLLVNFRTPIAIVAFVVNTINKLKTGNWLFFQYTSSENIVKKRRNVLLREVNELADDNIRPGIKK